MIKVNISPKDFFTKLGLGAKSELLLNVVAGTHRSVVVSHFWLTLEFAGVKSVTVNLPVSSIRIMTGKLSAFEYETARTAVDGFLKWAYTEVGLTLPDTTTAVEKAAEAIKLFTEGTETFMAEVQTSNEAIVNMGQAVLEDTGMLPEGVPLGSQVSIGQTYMRLAGFGAEHGKKLGIKVAFEDSDTAVRLKLFAVGKFLNDEVKKLQQFGFKPSVYPRTYSVSLAVPSSMSRDRLLGAVLFDLAEVFPVHVGSFKELVNEVDVVGA